MNAAKKLAKVHKNQRGQISFDQAARILAGSGAEGLEYSDNLEDDLEEDLDYLLDPDNLEELLGMGGI